MTQFHPRREKRFMRKSFREASQIEKKKKILATSLIENTSRRSFSDRKSHKGEKMNPT